MSWTNRPDTRSPHKSQLRNAGTGTHYRKNVYSTLALDEPYPFFTLNFSQPYPPHTELRKVWTKDGRKFFENHRGEIYSSSLTELWEWQAHPEHNVSINLTAYHIGLLEIKYGNYEGPDFEKPPNVQVTSAQGLDPARSVLDPALQHSAIPTGLTEMEWDPKSSGPRDRQERSTSSFNVGSSNGPAKDAHSVLLTEHSQKLTNLLRAEFLNPPNSRSKIQQDQPRKASGLTDTSSEYKSQSILDKLISMNSSQSEYGSHRGVKHAALLSGSFAHRGADQSSGIASVHANLETKSNLIVRNDPLVKADPIANGRYSFPTKSKIDPPAKTVRPSINVPAKTYLSSAFPRNDVPVKDRSSGNDPPSKIDLSASSEPTARNYPSGSYSFPTKPKIDPLVKSVRPSSNDLAITYAITTPNAPGKYYPPMKNRFTENDLFSNTDLPARNERSASSEHTGRNDPSITGPRPKNEPSLTDPLARLESGSKIDPPDSTERAAGNDPPLTCPPARDDPSSARDDPSSARDDPSSARDNPSSARDTSITYHTASPDHSPPTSFLGGRQAPVQKHPVNASFPSLTVDHMPIRGPLPSLCNTEKHELPLGETGSFQNANGRSSDQADSSFQMPACFIPKPYASNDAEKQSSVERELLDAMNTSDRQTTDDRTDSSIKTSLYFTESDLSAGTDFFSGSGPRALIACSIEPDSWTSKCSADESIPVKVIPGDFRISPAKALVVKPEELPSENTDGFKTADDHIQKLSESNTEKRNLLGNESPESTSYFTALPQREPEEDLEFLSEPNEESTATKDNTNIGRQEAGHKPVQGSCDKQTAMSQGVASGDQFSLQAFRKDDCIYKAQENKHGLESEAQNYPVFNSGFDSTGGLSTSEWEMSFSVLDFKLSTHTNPTESSSFDLGKSWYEVPVGATMESYTDTDDERPVSLSRSLVQNEQKSNEGESFQLVNAEGEDNEPETQPLLQNQITSQGWYSSTMDVLRKFGPAFCFRSPTLVLQQQKRDRVLSSLEEKLRNIYWKEINWTELHNRPVSAIFDFRFSSANGESLDKLTDDREFFNIQGMGTPRNVVVTGRPSFGKTTLCHLVKFSWTYGKPPGKQFQYCIYVSLDEINPDMDLEETVLFTFHQNCYGEFSVDDIRDAFQESEIEMLLLFDDYDKLTWTGRLMFEKFLCRRNLFKRATILVTSGLAGDCLSLDSFERVYEIQGFSRDYLMSVLNKTSIYSRSTEDQFEHNFGSDKRLVYLNGMPPSFVYYVAEMISRGICRQQKITSLFGFLKCAKEAVGLVQFENSKIAASYDDAFAVLGKLFFRALARGHYSFTEELLNAVGAKLGTFQKCLFYRDEFQHGSVWTVCHKLFLLYFATEYLRDAWTRLSNDKERTQFLESVFCGGNSTGDYVFGDQADRCLYYVGIIPEIVLKIEHPYNLSDSTFEMIHDVENVETSRAFDSLQMLMRFSTRHLCRFNFVQLDKEDPGVECEQAFEDLLNCLCFSSSCVDYDFFHNRVENAHFTRILVENPDEPGTEFHILCRAFPKCRIDRFYVDFSDRVLFDVSGFLCQFLTLYDIELITEDCSSYEKVVYQLLSSLVEASLQHPAIVNCFSDTVNRGSTIETNSITFKVLPSEEQIASRVEVVSLCTNKGSFDRKLYEAGVLLTNLDEILSSLRGVSELNKTARICLDLTFRAERRLLPL